MREPTVQAHLTKMEQVQRLFQIHAAPTQHPISTLRLEPRHFHGGTSLSVQADADDALSPVQPYPECTKSKNQDEQIQNIG